MVFCSRVNYFHPQWISVPQFPSVGALHEYSLHQIRSRHRGVLQPGIVLDQLWVNCLSGQRVVQSHSTGSPMIGKVCSGTIWDSFEWFHSYHFSFLFLQLRLSSMIVQRLCVQFVRGFSAVPALRCLLQSASMWMDLMEFNSCHK